MSFEDCIESLHTLEVMYSDENVHRGSMYCQSLTGYELGPRWGSDAEKYLNKIGVCVKVQDQANLLAEQHEATTREVSRLTEKAAKKIRKSLDKLRAGDYLLKSEHTRIVPATLKDLSVYSEEVDRRCELASPAVHDLSPIRPNKWYMEERDFQKDNLFFVVTRGRVPGIYNSRKTALEQTEGFSQSYMQKVSGFDKAVEFLNRAQAE